MGKTRLKKTHTKPAIDKRHGKIHDKRCDKRHDKRRQKTNNIRLDKRQRANDRRHDRRHDKRHDKRHHGSEQAQKAYSVKEIMNIMQITVTSLVCLLLFRYLKIFNRDNDSDRARMLIFHCKKHTSFRMFVRTLRKCGTNNNVLNTLEMAERTEQVNDVQSHSDESQGMSEGKKCIIFFTDEGRNEMLSLLSSALLLHACDEMLPSIEPELLTRY